MKIQDVIEDLKLDRSIQNANDLMDATERKSSQLAKRLKKYGIRVVCLMCSTEARHRPGEGRLRNRPCHECGMQRLRPVWWTEKYPTKAEAETKRVRGTAFLIR